MEGPTATDNSDLLHDYDINLVHCNSSLNGKKMKKYKGKSTQLLEGILKLIRNNGTIPYAYATYSQVRAKGTDHLT
jgi:hypothetical protein